MYKHRKSFSETSDTLRLFERTTNLRYILPFYRLYRLPLALFVVLYFLLAILCPIDRSQVRFNIQSKNWAKIFDETPWLDAKSYVLTM